VSLKVVSAVLFLFLLCPTLIHAQEEGVLPLAFGSVTKPATSTVNFGPNYSSTETLCSVTITAPFSIVTETNPVPLGDNFYVSVEFAPTASGTYSDAILLHYSNGSCSGGGNLTLQINATGSYTGSSPITAYINPKYVVVGVTYAPPGPSSSVTYSDSLFIGTTITTTSSFMSDVNLTITVTKDISAWTPIAGAGSKIANTESTDWIQGSNSSTTNTVSKQSTTAEKTSGPLNAFAPVNHDYDIIWIWFNPLLVYTVTPGTANVVWNGYGYDNHDLPGMDIVGIDVGWLNGDFGSSSSINTILARGWVTKNEHIVWPSGQGPGLTSTDIANVLKADVFVAGYTLPTPLPTTSADGRFTQIPYPPNPITYEQLGPTTTYNLVNTDTQTLSKGTSTGYKQSYGTELTLAGSAWLAGFTVDIKTSNTSTWNSTWQSTLTTTQTLTDALSITGPPCTTTPCNPIYTGPGEFIVFQDNQYGTFMFYPGN
jgi:hypothetical protein